MQVQVDLYPPGGTPATCNFELTTEKTITLNLLEYLRHYTESVGAVIRSEESSHSDAAAITASVQRWYGPLDCGGIMCDAPGDRAVAYTAQPLLTNYQAPVGALDCLAPYLGVAPERIAADEIAGRAETITRTLTITNANYFGPELAWEAESNAEWVTVEPITGTTPATVTVTLNMSGLPIGPHTASVTVRSTTPGTRDSPQPVPIEAAIRDVSYLPLVSRGR